MCSFRENGPFLRIIQSGNVCEKIVPFSLHRFMPVLVSGMANLGVGGLGDVSKPICEPCPNLSDWRPVLLANRFPQPSRKGCKRTLPSEVNRCG